MRRALALLLSLTALVGLATPVGAVKPDRYPDNLEGFLLEGLCGFDVQLDILRDRSKVIDFYDQAGNLVRTQYSGSIVIRLTNVDSGASVDLNVGGPASDVYNDDGTVTSTFRGAGLPLITDTNLTHGNFAFTFSSDFSELLGTPKAAGHTEDTCEMLAG